MKKQDNLSAVIILALIVFDVLIWRQIFFAGPPKETELVFLDVGQGDSILLTFPGGVQILTDAGPSRQVLGSLEKALGRDDRYIDLAVITHPQLDHYNGFNYLLKNYRFGAFLWNGRESENEEWKVFISEIAEAKIPMVVVGEGDTVRYGENVIEIISPNNLFVQSAEPNDTAIVEYLKTPQFKALLTGDIGFSAENYLAGKFGLQADVLKTAHHGSKTSSGDVFLRAVNPKVAVIQSGAGNRYGHPTKEALFRLEAAGAKIFRNDQNGTIRIISHDQKLKVFTER